jgi:hypothetical protein
MIKLAFVGVVLVIAIAWNYSTTRIIGGGGEEWRRVTSMGRVPTMEEFRARPHEPLLITAGACDGWDALDKWDRDAYLDETAGSAIFNVEVTKQGSEFGDIVGPTWGFESMNLSQFIARYRKPDPSGRRLYLNGRIPRSLHADFHLPHFVPCLQDESPPYSRLINMWFGRGGEISTLHNDLEDNVIHVVRGRKRVVLFAPNQSQMLYERRDFERTETRVSPIRNVWRKDAAFPRFDPQEMLVAEVGKGQALFIPALWWHHVESTSTGDDGVIAVNVWFDRFQYASRGLEHVYATPTDVLWEELKMHSPAC